MVWAATGHHVHLARVRTSSASTFVSLDDASWSRILSLSKGAERRFKTPAVSSGTISAVSPAAGSTVGSRTSVLQWADSRSDVFYVPNAFLYQELRHGGVTTSPNSYAVPAAFPLEPGTPYLS